jgi:hypothetical protein
MTASDEDAIALLRIELEDIEPLIWRRVAVPTSMSLKAVHNVIQAAMGWLDNHFYGSSRPTKTSTVSSFPTTLIGMSGSTTRRQPNSPRSWPPA